MAVRIRLQRKGARHMPFYRIVAADSRSPRDGRFIEQLGYYDPLKDPAEIKIDSEKVIEWFRKGAQPSETVKSLFSRLGIMETWHHISQGKSPEEIQQIQDEARKRAEAVAAMERRAKESARPAEKNQKAEPAVKGQAENAQAERDQAAEPSAAEPVAESAAEPPVAESAADDPAAVAESEHVNEVAAAPGGGDAPENAE
ncbi:MAG: 30S ribosomal protein S16 [Candidatus Eisenbacteria bacterium]|nr:30S ribosomal protein S16 [Candidatus Eisenbacteria bacterium]